MAGSTSKGATYLKISKKGKVIATAFPLGVTSLETSMRFANDLADKIAQVVYDACENRDLWAPAAQTVLQAALSLFSSPTHVRRDSSQTTSSVSLCAKRTYHSAFFFFSYRSAFFSYSQTYT